MKCAASVILVVWFDAAAALNSKAWHDIDPTDDNPNLDPSLANDTPDAEVPAAASTWPDVDPEYHSPNLDPSLASYSPSAEDSAHITYNLGEWEKTVPIFKPLERFALLQHTDGNENLCMEGHFVPELLIIGGIKASTTTLCMGLRYTPSAMFPLSRAQWINDTKSPAYWKEGHFFDFHHKQGVMYMAKNYPVCDKHVRKIAVDGSARYSVDPFVPRVIYFFYRNLSPRLKFVFLLRDPLNRLHSHYHHGKEQDWCPDFRIMSFKQIIQSVLKGNWRAWTGSTSNRRGEGCGDVLEASLYTHHIANYFHVFQPNQFTFIPFLYNVAPGKDGRPRESPAKIIWESMGAKGRDPPLFHANDRTHLSLTQELSASLIKAMRFWFETRTGPKLIAKQLVYSRAILYGYKGLQNIDSIAAWIRTNW